MLLETEGPISGRRNSTRSECGQTPEPAPICRRRSWSRLAAALQFPALGAKLTQYPSRAGEFTFQLCMLRGERRGGITKFHLSRDDYGRTLRTYLAKAKQSKLRVHGRKLVEIVNKVRLKAVLLFDERRICIDNDLPKIKHPWASCHETGHRILSWHKPFFFGDTAESLDPAYQADLEDEANYAAGRLLFLGDRFTRDARDVPATVEGVKLLAKRYAASLTTTLRRYVEQGPDIAMAMLVSTPSWGQQPSDQPYRWRHFVPSPQFAKLWVFGPAHSCPLPPEDFVRGGP